METEIIVMKSKKSGIKISIHLSIIKKNLIHWYERGSDYRVTSEIKLPQYAKLFYKVFVFIT